LVLNTESYETIPGPKDATGVRVRIHGEDEVPPRITSMGMDVPNGMKGSIGVAVKVVENLPGSSKPCGEKSLKYFTGINYTTEACWMDVKIEVVRQKCGCHPWMAEQPSRGLQLKDCTVYEWHTCADLVLWTFAKASSKEECPNRCSTLTYKPST